MIRADKGLAFLLQYENVAWYEDGVVRILDRRIYPVRTEYVTCRNHTEVAKAIGDMVTQSGGPYTAAAMGMALACYEARDQNEADLFRYMEKAAYTLSHARPTTQERMIQVVEGSMTALKEAIAQGKAVKDLPEALFDHALNRINKTYESYIATGRHLAGMIPDKGTVMTQCFAETIIGMMLLACREQNKQVRFICPETRPYLQGARLTSSVISDMGFETYLITDNMPGYILKEKKVDVFTSAADVITMDGYVVNKVGTFQIALAAHHWGIPYFVTGTPNRKHPSVDSVDIEERDAEQVLSFFGTRIAKEKVGAFYPAFDVTPPYLCGGVVTNKGIFSPYDLESYFKSEK